MYADKYSRRMKLDPGSMGLALVLNGTIVAGLISFAAPNMIHRIIDPPIDIFNVRPTPPPPPPEPQTPQVKSHGPTQKIDVVVPETIVQTSTTIDHPFIPPTTPTTTVGGTVDGGFVTPVKPPVLVGAQVDPRFANSFQPEYPPGERRAEHQGRVTVRVLIGTDGRVKQVERISAASDEFFAATQRRALEKWRFKPATRDGEPFEAWREMSVSFVMKNEDF